jgi:hypothetical protein
MLVLPAASSADGPGIPIFFTATISGTDYCHSAVVKFKSTVTIELTDTDMLITEDLTDPNATHTSLVLESSFAGTGGGAFSFSQIDGVFNGTYKANGNGATSFSGNINATFSDGCTRVATIKAKRVG